MIAAPAPDLIAPPTYGSLLRPAHVPGFLAAALVGRLSFGTVGLALLLLVEHRSGSYAVAGLAVAGFAATAAVLAPARTRWVERRGRRRTLPVLATGNALVLGVVALCGERLGSEPAVLVGLCALAGSLAPPLGPTTRGVWAELFAQPDLLRRAYSLDAAADEVLFTLGPLVIGVLTALAGPVAGVLATAALVLVGTLGMVVSPLCRADRAVPVRAHRAGPAAVRPSIRPRRGPLHAPGFGRLLLVMFGVGTGLGSIELVAVGVAGQYGTASTGALLATVALGGVTGAALYGRRTWRRPPSSQLTVLCAALGCALLLTFGASTLPLLVAVLFVCGLLIAPALIAGYLLADELSTRRTRAEASTLIKSFNNLGTSAGTATAGLVLQHSGLGAALLVAAAGMAVTTAASLAR